MLKFLNLKIIKTKEKSFTLVELLVVISVILLLLSTVVVIWENLRKKARDDKRYNDLSRLQNAIELYYGDYGSYPSSSAWQSICNNPNWIPGLVPNYIDSLPTDPLSCSGGYGYYYKSDGRDYKLTAILEIGENCGYGEKFFDPAKCGVSDKCIFCAIYSPGASSWVRP
jgi:type II secretory pathway pseudopilin PulG